MVGARPRARRPHARVRRRHLRLVQPDARAEGGRRLGRGRRRRLAVRASASPATRATGSSTPSSPATAAGRAHLLGQPAPDHPGAGECRDPVGGRDRVSSVAVGAEAGGRAADGGRPAAARRSRHRRRRRVLEGARQPRPRRRRRHPLGDGAIRRPDPAHRGGSPVGHRGRSRSSSGRAGGASSTPPCSDHEVYLAFMLPADDAEGPPCRSTTRRWIRSFPSSRT